MEDNIKILKSVSLDFGLAELRSDNILTFEPHKNLSIFNLEQLKTLSVVFNEITEGEPVLYYCNSINFSKAIGQEEKTYMKKHLPDFATAFATTEDSAIIRFTLYVFMHLLTPQIPIKMFKTKTNAINWLKTIQ